MCSPNLYSNRRPDSSSTTTSNTYRQVGAAAHTPKMPTNALITHVPTTNLTIAASTSSPILHSKALVRQDALLGLVRWSWITTIPQWSTRRDPTHLEWPVLGTAAGGAGHKQG
jgi:hypothetical protein